MEEIRGEIKRVVSAYSSGVKTGSTKIKFADIKPEILQNLIIYYTNHDLVAEKKVLSQAINHLFAALPEILPDNKIESLTSALYHLIISTNDTETTTNLIVKLNELINKLNKANKEIIDFVIFNDNPLKFNVQAELLLGIQYFVKTNYLAENKSQAINLITQLISSSDVTSFDSLIQLIHSIHPSSEEITRDLIDAIWYRIINSKNEKLFTLVFLELAELTDLGVDLHSEHVIGALDSISQQIEAGLVEKEKIIALSYMFPFLPVDIVHFTHLIYQIAHIDFNLAIKLLKTIRDSEIDLLPDEAQLALLTELSTIIEAKDPIDVLSSLIGFSSLILEKRGTSSIALSILEGILIKQPEELITASLYAFESVILCTRNLSESLLKAFIPHTVNSEIANQIFDLLISKHRSQSVLISKTLAELRILFKDKTKQFSDKLLKAAGFPSKVTEESAAFVHEYAQELITHDDPDDLTIAISILLELEPFSEDPSGLVESFSRAYLLVRGGRIYGLYQLLKMDLSALDTSLPYAQSKDDLEQKLLEMCLSSLPDNLDADLCMILDSQIGNTPRDEIERVFGLLESVLPKCQNESKGYIIHAMKQLAKSDLISYERINKLIEMNLDYQYQLASVCVKKDLEASAVMVKSILDSLPKLAHELVPDALCPVVSYALRNREDKAAMEEITNTLYDMSCIPDFDVSVAVLSSLGALLRASESDRILDYSVFFQIRDLWDEAVSNESIENISSVAILALEISSSFSEGNSFILRLLCEVFEFLPLPPDYFDMEAAIECICSLVEYEWVLSNSDLCIKIMRMVGLIITQKSQIQKYDLTGDTVAQARDCFKTIASIRNEYLLAATEWLSGNGILPSTVKSLLK